MVDPDFASTYVVACVDLARQLVAISQQVNEKLLNIYDYSLRLLASRPLTTMKITISKNTIVS